MKKVIISESLTAVIEEKKDILSRDDIDIYIASSGEEILDIQKLEKADLIITDLDLPGMDGDEVCSRLREDEASRNVFFIIACSNEKDAIARVYACKANVFISKPVHPDELFGKIRKFFSSVTERDNTRVIVEVIVRGTCNEDNFFALSEDMSISGILIETYKVLQEGDEIQCSFFLGQNRISCIGKVVRSIRREDSNQNHYGIHFTSLSSFSKDIIEKFLRSV